MKSPVSASWSSSASADQASGFSSLERLVTGQCASGFVFWYSSLGEANPSQSGSLAGAGQGGGVWAGLDQAGQLSALSSTPSPSESTGSEGGAGVDVGSGDGAGVGVGVG